MRRLLREIICLKLIKWSLKVMPDNDFKLKYSKFLIDNIENFNK